MIARCGGTVCVVAVLCLAATARGGELLMRAPMTYVIDYSQRYLDDDANIRAFAAAPPDLMHVGKSVPILHNWGAVPLISGENQYTGAPSGRLHPENLRLLTPAEVEQRIALLKAYTKKWHDIGVPRLVAYTCTVTVAGDHEQREGLWRFYDRWDDYAKWLGPKPEKDVTDWLMRDRNGDFVGYGPTLTPEYYAPLKRYRACPENPFWQDYQKRLTRLNAEVGYDGVFPDNANPRNQCFCPYCREGFRAFVRGRSARELAILGAQGDPAALQLDSPETPAELVRRYRIDAYSRSLRMIRAAGQEVNRDFVVFPNTNSWREFMPMAASCDYLMFESTYSPGSRVAGPPPDEPFATVEAVGGAAAAQRNVFEFSVLDPATFVELSARIEFPRQVRLGAPAAFNVAVRSVGSSDRDNDFAEKFALVLADLQTGEERRLPLTPEARLGGGAGAQRPPADLQASWTPAAPGRFKVRFAFEYTDPDHRDVVNARAFVHDLNWGAVYHTHIGQLLFTMHSPARTVLLDYECRRRGKENVMELGLAECAAFSNGSTVAAIGAPREKYHRFFKRNTALYEGYAPYADIGLLYDYWGRNPGGMGLRPSDEITPSMDLSGRQRLIKVLMDRTLAPEDLAALRTLIVSADAIELDDAQVEAVKRFAAGGGAVYVFRPAATVNGRPWRDVLPEAREWAPGADVPGHAALLDARGLRRGLRFSAFVRPAERRMTLHVLNYNVAINETPAEVTPVPPTQIALPLPEGWQAVAVLAHDPDDEAVGPVAFAQEGRTLRLTLPTVRIYRLIEIEAR